MSRSSQDSSQLPDPDIRSVTPMRLLPFLLALPVALFGVTTEDVLSKLDQSATKFNSMTANLTRLTYTKVIDDKSIEEGKMSLKKTGGRDLEVLIDFVKPDPRTVAFGGRRAEIYYPKL